LVDLKVDSKVMRLASEDVAAGIKQAFGQARLAAQAEVKAVNGRPAGLDDAAVTRLAQVSEESLKRLADLAGIAQSISDKLGTV
jgi:hypothetical protein